MSTVGFLGVPDPTDEARQIFDEDLAEVGYVMNASRLWAYQPATVTGLFDLLRKTSSAYGLKTRQRGILVAACASAFGDSYCSLAWGTRLAAATDAQTAAGVLRGEDDGLTAAERAMADWARKVVRDPHRIGRTDVRHLRDAGWSDEQIFAMTVFVALRIAFSTVNNALGAHPDAAFRGAAPEAVVDAVTYGRPIETEPAQIDLPTL